MLGAAPEASGGPRWKCGLEVGQLSHSRPAK